MTETTKKKKSKVVMDSNYFSKTSNVRWERVRNAKISTLATKIEGILTKNAGKPSKDVALTIAKLVTPKPKPRTK